MLNSTQAFLDPLEQWVKAVREDDFARARSCAELLVREGEMLAQHPDFKRCFTRRCECDTHEALAHLCQFLVCAGDGRASALKQDGGLLGGAGGLAAP
jgi:hypothetical protein